MTDFRPLPEPLDRPIRLGVLISGGGTTMVNFLEKIRAGSLNAEIATVIASKASCAGLVKAEVAGLSNCVIARNDFDNIQSFSAAVFQTLREAKVDLVTLAGYLSKLAIPEDFRCRVLNIHPSLIPAFSGKGFYGHHVHEHVLARGVKLSGCTVHFVDDEYDHGPIILQKSVPVKDDDTLDTLAARVFEAECEAFPDAIRKFASGTLVVNGAKVRSDME